MNSNLYHQYEILNKDKIICSEIFIYYLKCNPVIKVIFCYFLIKVPKDLNHSNHNKPTQSEKKNI